MKPGILPTKKEKEMSDTVEETVTSEETSEAAPSPTSIPSAGIIHNMGLLDLRSAKTPEDLSGITALHNIGCVIIPEHLASVLMRIPMENVGTVAPVPSGENIQVQVGQVWLSGEAIAAGDSDAILFTVGQLFLTTPVTSVGFKEIRVHGQVLAIRGSEAALGSKVKSLTGQIFYLPAKARTIMGSESIGQEFLELLPEPTALVIMGELTFEQDVTKEMLKSKILEMVLMGHIKAPQALVPLVQVLTIEKMGEISSY